MKRVFCLYRVSTLGQVDVTSNDIPMQQQACHEYVEHNPDWVIVKEFSEKGVSGFKVSAKDRDVIQELQRAAVAGEFDILLVFMFDRIGRKEDETPFIVEFFVNHGVEVWSVNEGQQRFDSHVDKLMNYIRYWQASGESIKTSIRTKTRMGQIVMEGHFKGGTAPFGYSLERLGRINKKGHEVYDLVINDEEASLVRFIFDRHSNAGMGPQTIAAYLTEEGLLNRSGRNFVAPSIRNIVRNPMYRGILRCGDSVTEPFEHLRIIDDETFFRSQDLIKQRADRREEIMKMSRKPSTNCMLIGRIYCGHCGARLISSTAGRKRVNKDGSITDKRYWHYRCYNRMRHKMDCCGNSSYKTSIIDEAVSQIVRNLLSSFKDVPLESILGKRREIELKDLRAQIASAQQDMQRKIDELGSLKKEVVKSIRGESTFTQELLGDMIQVAEKDRKTAEENIANLTEVMSDAEKMDSHFREQHRQLISWAEIFDSCEYSVKKLIVCQLVEKILVYDGYKIEVILSISMQQYLELCETKVKLTA